MPETPRDHFDEDIERAFNLLEYAEDQDGQDDEDRIAQDMRYSAIGMAVGAMDAYFCDAYVDCLTAVLQAYVRGDWDGDLPSKYKKQQLPAGEVLDQSRKDRPLWRLRMASRSVMEKNNMLSIGRIKRQFNGILPDSQKLWFRFVDKLINYDYRRFTSVDSNDIEGLSGPELRESRREAINTFKERVGQTIQIRHDWIHNCGRPKSAINTIGHYAALARIREIKILVTEFDDHIEAHRLA